MTLVSAESVVHRDLVMQPVLNPMGRLNMSKFTTCPSMSAEEVSYELALCMILVGPGSNMCHVQFMACAGVSFPEMSSGFTKYT